MGEGASGEVDFGFLRSYAAGDESFVREVLKVFVVEAAEWRARLTGGGDWRAVVHTIKGTSRTIGAAGLGDLCERAEAEGEGLLPQVRERLAAVLAEVEAYLGA